MARAVVDVACSSGMIDSHKALKNELESNMGTMTEMYEEQQDALQNLVQNHRLELMAALEDFGVHQRRPTSEGGPIPIRETEGTLWEPARALRARNPEKSLKRPRKGLESLEKVLEKAPKGLLRNFFQTLGRKALGDLFGIFFLGVSGPQGNGQRVPKRYGLAVRLGVLRGVPSHRLLETVPLPIPTLIF